MMVLKYRYGLGFESLCREVADSIAWRRFCRIPLDCPVPHPSTLEKITVRAGERTIEELNEELVVKAAEQKVVKMDRVRADTTVVPANVCYPSDSGLLDRGVARLSAWPASSRRWAWPAGPRSGTAPAPCAAAVTPLAAGCAAAAIRPRRRCWP